MGMYIVLYSSIPGNKFSESLVCLEPRHDFKIYIRYARVQNLKGQVFEVTSTKLARSLKNVRTARGNISYRPV